MASFLRHLQRTRSRRGCLAGLAGSVAAVIAAQALTCAFLSPPGDGSFVRESRLMGSSLLAGPALLGAEPAQAASDVVDASSQPPVALIGVLVILAAGVALLSGGDSSAKVDDKKVVESYFNNEGFERWQKIYGETDDVNPVQKDIRVGHAQTVDKILNWLDSATIAGKAVCDAGCGTGNLSIPLASRGAIVTGSDISSAMVGEAADRAKAKLSSEQMPKFFTSDLEALDGKFDTVCCVDVLIHYPPDNMKGMVQHLAGMSKERLVLSFAPKTWYYTALKRIGELFPGKSKTTRAYLHEEELVEAALEQAGFQVTRREMTSTNFYFSRLFEAKPKATA
eukprot:TRINITY_DN109603_c0_g1_i1.p1 TRINITY_DN109603_c0_g1~~TRINITY_DN109603_c0_g1_i1.p1  ORF type:complete len:338 (-),score=73.99 TRINITY_DN109603_c0_g1_i1:70-1083(-)